MLDISGSAWESYKKTGKVNGMTMPQNLKESDKLEHPIWTPRFVTSYSLPWENIFIQTFIPPEAMLIYKFSTKAAMGESDENISPEKG